LKNLPRWVLRKHAIPWGVMFVRNKKNHLAIFVIFYFLWSAWQIMSLSGCIGNKNIPPASMAESGKITLSWNSIPGASSYNVYFSTSPGVTRLNGYRISNAANSITITGLEPGTTYYFIVTVVNELGESEESNEKSYTVADTAGFIDFKDLSFKSMPDYKSLESEKGQVALAPEKKLVGKKPEPLRRHVETDKSDYEIIICFGDSLTFGTGASNGMDYPSQLERMINKPVIKAGVPGDTTAWALRRLKRDVLSKKPDVVLITLGGNDLKNGVSKDITFSNLKKIVETIQKRGAKVIIGGLKFLNKDRGFAKGYEELAEQTGAILIPNIFEGIMGNRKLMSDPIHPNDSGYTIIAQRFYDAMVPYTASQALDEKQGTQKVTLAWDNVPNAISYNIYWDSSPGITKHNAKKISNVKNPHTIKGLKRGTTYYFVVTAVNELGESEVSEEISYTVAE